MRVVVTDVSVFFDLFEIQVLPEFFCVGLGNSYNGFCLE